MIELLVTIYFILGIPVTIFCLWVRFKGDWSQLAEIPNIQTAIYLYFAYGWVIPISLYKVYRTVKSMPDDEKKD